MTDTQRTSPATRAALPSPVLAIQDLSVSFHGRSGENQALKGISFAIHPGEIVAVVGESGSGKSVTSLAVMGLLANNGRIDRGSMQFRMHVSAPVAKLQITAESIAAVCSFATGAETCMR